MKPFIGQIGYYTTPLHPQRRTPVTIIPAMVIDVIDEKTVAVNLFHADRLQYIPNFPVTEAPPGTDEAAGKWSPVQPEGGRRAQ